MGFVALVIVFALFCAIVGICKSNSIKWSE